MNNDEFNTNAQAPGQPAEPRNGKNKKRAKRGKNRRILWYVLAAVGALLLVGGIVLAVNLDAIMNRPEDLFSDTLTRPTNVVATRLPDAVNNDAEPGRTLSPDQQDSSQLLGELQGVADYTFVDAPQLEKNIINILLIGVDWAEERQNNDKEYVGKNFNSDVMMLLAVNLDDRTASMISVPRDSYAHIPDAKAPYKLNFSLTFGGGMNEKGFMKVCDSVEYLLGGIPVDYYMAVTMPVVKELGDAVGGVDFNIDVPFTIQGRSYEVGPQHLDGQGILDYCRARKNMNESGDQNRVDRQKEMLFTVFKKLQRSEMILQVPQIVTSMKDRVFTNLSFNQFAALALIGLELDPNDVSKYTFSGTHTNIFNYGYVLTNQQKRIQIIKEVYGVTVKQQVPYSPEFARLKWATMLSEHYISLVEPMLKKEASLAEDAKVLAPDVYLEMQTLLTTCKEQLEEGVELLEKAEKAAPNTDVKKLVEPYEELEESYTTLRELAEKHFKGTSYAIGSKKWFLDLYEEEGIMRMKE